MALQPLEPGPTHGLWQVGQHILTNGDLIEFADDDKIVPGRVAYEGQRYIVVAGDRWLPLSEIMQARYMGSGRL